MPVGAGYAINRVSFYPFLSIFEKVMADKKGASPLSDWQKRMHHLDVKTYAKKKEWLLEWLLKDYLFPSVLPGKKSILNGERSCLRGKHLFP
jgi:hypothetical protein